MDGCGCRHRHHCPCTPQTHSRGVRGREPPPLGPQCSPRSGRLPSVTGRPCPSPGPARFGPATRWLSEVRRQRPQVCTKEPPRLGSSALQGKPTFSEFNSNRTVRRWRSVRRRHRNPCLFITPSHPTQPRVPCLALERGGEVRRGALGWASIRSPRPARFVEGEVRPPPIVPGKRAEAAWGPLGALNTGGAQEP